MSARQVLKKLLIPGAAVVGVTGGHISGPHCSKCSSCVCKPSELPIYQLECPACKATSTPAPPGELENAISKIRKELWVWQDEVAGYKEKVVHFVDTGIAHSSSTIDFLKEEATGPERAGAIGLASLSGYILGLRGGVFKRLTYATIGGVSMASICYPKEAAEYSQVAVEEAKKYLVAGYHFIFGEAPTVPEWLDPLLGKAQEKVKQVTAKDDH